MTISRAILIGLIAILAWSRALGADDLSEKFYDPQAVQKIELEIRTEDLARLNEALPQRISVPAEFRWNGQTLRKVGLRYKGNSSSHSDSRMKRSFLIDFAEFEKGQRFLGLRHVALDNGIQFGSLFSERLITDILRAEGIKASRCNYARVYLNQKDVGVYVNVERIDKSFLTRHFSDDRGPLFKVEGGPGANLRFVGDDPVEYRKGFEVHAGKEREGYANLIHFIRSLNAPAGSETALRRDLDVDAFIKTTAVMLLAGAFDQYTGWNAHNYYLYRNPGDQRWTYIPWDLDVGFADKAFGKIPVLEGWNAAWPAPVPERPLMERLISNPTLLKEYRKEAGVILEKWFRPEVLVPKLRGLYAQIQKDLADDPFPPRRATNPEDRRYAQILESMEQFIRVRYTSAKAQLASPGERPTPRQGDPQAAQEGPKPGPPSADAPTELRALKVTPSSVELAWKDHARDEVAHVVQRSSGGEGGDFVNAIGQGGAEITSAIDRNVEPGKTYRYRVYAVLPTPQGPRGTGVSNVIEVRVPKE